MIRSTMLTAAIAACTVSAAPAAAGGLPVFDSATYLQTLSTVRNTLTLIDQAKAQIGEAQRLYQSMNRLTQVNSLGTILNAPDVRNLLPAEVLDIETLTRGELGSGSIESRARAILDRAGLASGTTAGTRVNAAYQAAIDQAAHRSAVSGAVAGRIYDATVQRTRGLEQLRQALDQATDAKQVADLQARIAVESAHIQNDQIKVQAIAMRQAAEEDPQLRADDARIVNDIRGGK